MILFLDLVRSIGARVAVGAGTRGAAAHRASDQQGRGNKYKTQKKKIKKKYKMQNTKYTAAHRQIDDWASAQQAREGKQRKDYQQASISNGIRIIIESRSLGKLVRFT